MGIYKEEAQPLWLIASQVKNKTKVGLFQEKRFELNGSLNVFYSPIYPAFLDTCSADIDEFKQSRSRFIKYLERIDLVVSKSPHRLLRALYSEYAKIDLLNVYISNGHASIIIINSNDELYSFLEQHSEVVALEAWFIKDGLVLEDKQKLYVRDPVEKIDNSKIRVFFDSSKHEKDSVFGSYIEQINICLGALADQNSKLSKIDLYSVYSIAAHIRKIIEEAENCLSIQRSAELEERLDAKKKLRASEAVLIEYCAALSYCVTQGTTGFPPILKNPSPFPHNRLLGVGNSVRALKSFVHHISRALVKHSANNFINYQLKRNTNSEVLCESTNYLSGEKYKTISGKSGEVNFLFDLNSEGLEPENKPVPLLSYFSLRHGFKESPISVTAASESLSHELQPHWTLMTLSHEVMHSRVRGMIDNIMFFSSSDELTEHYEQYKKWSTVKDQQACSVMEALRNVVYTFCEAWESSLGKSPKVTNGKELRQLFTKHKMKVVELVVHFHDYFFIYQADATLYFTAIWTSWSKVSTPYLNPEYYLLRSLATASIGTGKSKSEAYKYARGLIVDVFEDISDSGWKSDLVLKCHNILKREIENENGPSSKKKYGRHYEKVKNNIKYKSQFIHQYNVSYYLLDQFSLIFSSLKLIRELHNPIDIEFERSGHGVVVFGDETPINPLTFMIDSVKKSLANKHEVDDSGWLSTWNSIVISSYQTGADK